MTTSAGHLLVRQPEAHGEDVHHRAGAAAAIGRALQAATKPKVPALLHLHIDPATMPPTTAVPTSGAEAGA